jgi:NAD(P)-dependent dehydrogenase (short-subunit alcohol dehydrogenase family)
MIDFAGRTAFVTGGANGIGIGLVRALLAEGCKVALADIREDHIERALKSLDNQLVMGVKVDVSSREDMARARCCSTTPGSTCSRPSRIRAGRTGTG